MKQLAKLLTAYDAITAEIERHRTKDTTLEAEEKTILDGASLDDPEVFKQVSHIRLMREIIPRKITQMQGQLVPLTEQMVPVIREVCEDFNQRFSKVAEESRKRVRAALAPLVHGEFFADGQHSGIIETLALAHPERVASQRFLFKNAGRFYSCPSGPDEAAEQARALLKDWADYLAAGGKE